MACSMTVDTATLDERCLSAFARAWAVISPSSLAASRKAANHTFGESSSAEENSVCSVPIRLRSSSRSSSGVLAKVTFTWSSAAEAARSTTSIGVADLWPQWGHRWAMPFAPKHAPHVGQRATTQASFTRAPSQAEIGPASRAQGLGGRCLGVDAALRLSLIHI